MLVHYGLTEYNYYSVLFGLSRSLGVMAAQCWSRALGFPLERPKSLTSDWIFDFVKNQKMCIRDRYQINADTGYPCLLRNPRMSPGADKTYYLIQNKLPFLSCII